MTSRPRCITESIAGTMALLPDIVRHIATSRAIAILARSRSGPPSVCISSLSHRYFIAYRDDSRYLGQSMRLMVGLPKYEPGIVHMAPAHPGEPMMSYDEFFRERQHKTVPKGRFFRRPFLSPQA